MKATGRRCPKVKINHEGLSVKICFDPRAAGRLNNASHSFQEKWTQIQYLIKMCVNA